MKSNPNNGKKATKMTWIKITLLNLVILLVSITCWSSMFSRSAVIYKALATNQKSIFDHGHFISFDRSMPSTFSLSRMSFTPNSTIANTFTTNTTELKSDILTHIPARGVNSTSFSLIVKEGARFAMTELMAKIEQSIVTGKAQVTAYEAKILSIVEEVSADALQSIDDLITTYILLALIMMALSAFAGYQLALCIIWLQQKYRGWKKGPSKPALSNQEATAMLKILNGVSKDDPSVNVQKALERSKALLKEAQAAMGKYALEIEAAKKVEGAKKIEAGKK